eukprot:TRINITY_DN15597_c0_g1_i1.p1 TRINITY_DN15597_c0_g1~~TRINITY_DN15597_c0_g1_i1.p1  ORF type:complete len:208 (-),score=51.80 TRINITY_DN15597_c0_g1_i1:210-833(-)
MSVSKTDKIKAEEESPLTAKEEEDAQRTGLGSYLWSLLFGPRQKCRSKISIKRKSKGAKKTGHLKNSGGNKKNKKRSDEEALNQRNATEEDDEDSDGGTFGIQKTEKLKCFVKPRPPQHRRRPTSSMTHSSIFIGSEDPTSEGFNPISLLSSSALAEIDEVASETDSTSHEEDKKDKIDSIPPEDKTVSESCQTKDSSENENDSKEL